MYLITNLDAPIKIFKNVLVVLLSLLMVTIGFFDVYTLKIMGYVFYN